jgi:hypothetical protein
MTKETRVQSSGVSSRRPAMAADSLHSVNLAKALRGERPVDKQPIKLESAVIKASEQKNGQESIDRGGKK